MLWKDSTFAPYQTQNDHVFQGIERDESAVIDTRPDRVAGERVYADS